jgi:hypothetical protein
VAKSEHRGLVRDPVADQIYTSKAAHGGHINQGHFHGRITEAGPLLQQVDPKRGWKGIRRAATLVAGLGLVRLEQSVPPHDSFHLRMELLPVGLPVGGRLLEVQKPQAACHLSVQS